MSKIMIFRVASPKQILEPVTRALSIVFPTFFGGGEEDRTPGLLLAKQALSQLSYTPQKNNYLYLITDY